MNLRWLLLDYVDPELKLTQKQRRQVRERALNLNYLDNTSLRKRPRRWWHYFVVLLPSIGFVPLFLWMAMGQPHGPWLVALFVVTICVPYLLAAWLARYTWRPHIARALREQGYDVCAHCGYWLRGLSDDVMRCPECGETRTPMPMQPVDTQPEPST